MESEQIERLIQAAREVSRNAYRPYSDFPVGAAVLTADGQIFAGCNVENASYGLTICAERNAVFQMVAHGHREVVAVAVYTPSIVATPPCGACRQVLNEFGPDAKVIAVCDSDDRIETRVSALLPKAFGPQNLRGEVNEQAER